MNRRYWFLSLLCLLAIITYLDRISISVAGPRIQSALNIDAAHWGWVGTAFLIGYGLFEIPSGHLGDRLGARRVLTRIVLWWSAFTALTGAVSGFAPLLIVRFLFGAGEAGSFPNASVAISNWFTPATQGRAFGLFMMCSQIGGALTPLVVIPIQQAYGWRASFYLFAALGAMWSLIWFWQFRDRPRDLRHDALSSSSSWKSLLRSKNLWAIMALTFGYVYTMSFYQTWFHTYLAKGRNFSEQELSWSAMPYVFGAAANLLGGLSCDWSVRKIGLRWSRRIVGMTGLFLSTVGVTATIFVHGHLLVILGLSLAYAGITFQQPAVFSACVDIGSQRSGAVSGFMNTAGQFGGAFSSAIFGYIVSASGSYDRPLIPMSILLLFGMVLWMKVDVTQKIE